MQPGHIDQIGNHGGRGLLGTRACAVIHRDARRIAFHHDAVHGAFHAGQQTFDRDQRRMHAQFNAVRHPLGDAQQLDAVTELKGVEAARKTSPHPGGA